MPHSDYYCPKCEGYHKYSSKVGRAHRHFGDAWLEERKAWQKKYEVPSP